MAKPIQQAMHESGFAGTGFAGEHGNSLPGFNAEQQFRKSSVMTRGGIIEPRIWRNMKGILPEPEKQKKLIKL